MDCTSPSSPDVDLNPIRGRKAVEHFIGLEPAQRYHHLRRLFRLSGNNSLPSAAGKEITFLHIPEMRCMVWLWPSVLRADYRHTRYESIQQSLLTATLYVQRPLTEDEAQAVTYWSAKEGSRLMLTGMLVLLLAGSFPGMGPDKLVRWCMTPLMKRYSFWRRQSVIRYTKEFAIEDLKDTSVLIALSSIPWAYSMAVWRRRERSDTRLQALSQIEREEKPESWRERYGIWTSGYCATVVPRQLINRPTFRELSNDPDHDKWRKLKYETETFIRRPPEPDGVMEDSDLWHNE